MSTQTIIQQVRWQDLKVRSEVDVVLEIARKAGWEDCEIFGSGDMITQPQELKGWKLIPADLYEGSIPTEGIGRVYRIINAGVRIRGIIIADDERRTEPPPAPATLKDSLPSIKPIMASFGQTLLRLICIAGVIALVSLLALSLIYFAPVILLGALTSAVVDYDPKLVILVDDGKGGTVWVSVLTWYD